MILAITAFMVGMVAYVTTLPKEVVQTPSVIPTTERPSTVTPIVTNPSTFTPPTTAPPTNPVPSVLPPPCLYPR